MSHGNAAIRTITEQSLYRYNQTGGDAGIQNSIKSIESLKLNGINKRKSLKGKKDSGKLRDRLLERQNNEKPN